MNRSLLALILYINCSYGVIEKINIQVQLSPNNSNKQKQVFVIYENDAFNYTIKQIKNHLAIPTHWELTYYEQSLDNSQILANYLLWKDKERDSKATLTLIIPDDQIEGFYKNKEKMKMIPRTMANELKQSAKSYPAIALLGPRFAGKTTLAQATFPSHKYISLEEVCHASHATNDPRDFLRIHQNEHGIILDEFQLTPDLLSYIQTYIDEHKKPGYFILVSSQNYLMNKNIKQTLAGRIAIHTLLPLTIKELKGASKEPDQPEQVLFNGLYPSIWTNDSSDLYNGNTEKGRQNITKWYSNYINTYVERDIRQITEVSDLLLFQKFVVLLAARIGQILNLSSLASECGISDVTVKKWLSLLEASYIIYLLYPYYRNFNKRLVKSPKIYFYDPGLACALLKIPYDLLPVHPIKGSLFESFAIVELAKSYHNQGLRPPLYYWRDYTGNEIDCILESGLQLTPIEIKSNITVNQSFFDGFKYWERVAGNEASSGFVIYGGTETQKRSADTLVGWKSIHEIVK